MSLRTLLKTFLAFIAAALLSEAVLLASVRRVRVPEDGISPDVAVGESGVVYLVYARDSDALFAVSTDAGKTFSNPVRLNVAPGSVLAGRERGPKMAVGRNESLHVVWMDKKSEHLEYVRGIKRGRSFSAPRELLDAATHLDGATVAADRAGNVLVSWLDARLPPDPDSPISQPVFLSHSNDDGVTFSRNQKANADHAVAACSCCALESLAWTAGNIAIAFRGAYQNIRDPHLLRIDLAAPKMNSALNKISDHRWVLNGCPMSGLFLSRGLEPFELWAAWMSDGHVYYAPSTDGGKRFNPSRTPSRPASAAQNHPFVLENARGEVFLAWEEGRTLRWQISSRGGDMLDSAEAGMLPGNTKATGFVDLDGNFCLVF